MEVTLGNNHGGIAGETREYGLADVWRILVRRKLIIFVTIIVVVAAAGALVSLSPRVYKSRAVFEIGKLADIGKVESADKVIATLKEQYGHDGNLGEGPMPRLSSLLQANENMIVLVAQAYAPEAARAYLSHVTAQLISDHQKLYDAAREKIERRLREYDVAIAEIKRQLKDLEESRQNSTDAAQATVVAVERAQLLSALPKIQDEREKVAVSLNSIATYPSRLISDATLSKKPVAPKPVAYFVFASVFGLLLAGFLVVVAEAISKARVDPR